MHFTNLTLKNEYCKDLYVFTCITYFRLIYNKKSTLTPPHTHTHTRFHLSFLFISTTSPVSRLNTTQLPEESLFNSTGLYCCPFFSLISLLLRAPSEYAYYRWEQERVSSKTTLLESGQCAFLEDGTTIAFLD